MVKGFRVQRHVDRVVFGPSGPGRCQECSPEHDAKTPRLSTWHLPFFIVQILDLLGNLHYRAPRRALFISDFIEF